MTIPLLSTKLFIPPPRLNLVARERLILRLNDGIRQRRPFVLVSASAGFGKTTLVSAWLKQIGPDWAIAWVSLDEGDNDPALFVRYLAASLQEANLALGENIQSVLSTIQAAAQITPLLELCTLLVNAISQNKKKLILVLDDYHLIHALEIHAFVQLLIERQPEGMHTVLLTREDPPFPLPRLRARGQVTEIRERDLRFTQLEAQAFFEQSMGLELLPRWVAILETYTEGWVAGLQLAALAIQECPEPDKIEQFLQTFAGTDRYVIDYLLDEVYHRQPAEIQDFLLRSSVLQRMCAPLCDQLLDVEAAPEQQKEAGQSFALLQRLERSNLFLIPLDNLRLWYRYHHLFAELLQHRLAQEKNPAFIGKLHRAACEWFESEGFILDAIYHAFQMRDWEFAVSLVERYAMSIVSHSQMTTMLKWYQQIPEEVLRERPLACIYMAWTLVLIFREDLRPTVESWLERAEDALRSERLPQTARIGPDFEPVNLRDFVSGQAAVIRSQNLLAALRDPVDPQTLLDLSQQALDLLPPSARVERSVCVINQALAQLLLSQAEAAEPALRKAFQLAKEAENYFGAVTAVWYQVRLAFYQGQPDRAEEICREGHAYFRSVIESPERDLPAIRSLYVAEAILRLEQNRLDEAERLLERSLDITGWATWVEIWAFQQLVRLQHARGNFSGALQTLDRMEKMGPQHMLCADGLRILHQLTAPPPNPGAFDQARAWAQSHAPDQKTYGVVTGLGPYHCDTLYLKDLTWARVQIALGEASAALAFIEPTLAVARQNGLVYRVVELLALKALAHNAARAREAALKIIQEALALAEPCGYVRVFDQGPEMDRLLTEAARVGIYGEFIQKCSAAFDRSFVPDGVPVAARQPLSPRSMSLVEPLSQREQEVLHLIAEGCSNAEICKKLVIASGTVKRHINSIYGKLGVQSRTQAVSKARQLQLID